MIQISNAELAMVLDIIRRLAPECTALVFGSRQNGNAKKHSDLDIALEGAAVLGWRRVAAVKYAFEESDIPFRVDVLDYRAVEPWFREVIDSSNEVIYRPHA
jgi:type I restriction enzyme S subunit